MKKDDERGAGATGPTSATDGTDGTDGTRAIAAGGDPYGTHRALDPAGGLPQPAWRLDNDFARLFEGEVLLAVETLNIDAASFAQMEAPQATFPTTREQGRPLGDAVARATDVGKAVARATDDEIAHIILRTVRERGKQHNPVTGSGGMLLGRVVQIAPGRPPVVPTELRLDDRVATLVSLSLTPLRIDRIHAIRRASAQVDVDGEAVFFASSPYAKLPGDLPEKVALAALDVAGAAPQVARLVKPGDVVVVLGAGGKSGILCAMEARRRGGPGATVIGVEANEGAAAELRALDCCDVVAVADARNSIGVRRAVLDAAAGREADVTFSCVNVPDAETAAILATRERGVAYFFAMSTSFTKAALGAEGVGKDIDLFIGNGYARGHAEHTLTMLREFPRLLALFERRYGR